jgi:3-phosphoshikimate 1-carboxyvinyltransferase
MPCVDVAVYGGWVEGVATPPPSKSYTHRAFISSALSRRSIVTNPLISDDTLATLNCCSRMGAKFKRSKDVFEFRGCDVGDAKGYYYTANSGTTLRLFMGILSLSKNRCVLDGDGSIRKRPNKELAIALKRLGADVKGYGDYKAPIWVRGVLRGGEIEIKAMSSQFISSLLFALSLAKGDSVLRVLDVKSKPYIDVTLHVLKDAGVEIEREGMVFYISGEQDFNLRRFNVPSDFSSASYLIACGVLAGDVEIRGLFRSMQGDRAIVEIVKEMGGDVRWDEERGILRAKRSDLEGIEVDARDTPDLVPTIAVLGAVASGKTVIYNAEHLRFKEIDRIEGIYKNLRSLGIDVEKRRDGLTVRGGEIEGGTVESFGDHRMALAFSILGLVSKKGVVVKNADVVSVSYPQFFDVLEGLGARIERFK